MSKRSYPKPKQFIPMNPHKYAGNASNIIMRSSWESKLAKWADSNPSVISWGSETIIVPYYSACEGKMRRYYIDFFINYKTSDGSTRKIIVEVKPYAQTIKPIKRGRKTMESFINECKTYQVNQDKWKSANEWAKQHGMEFIILTEYELGLKAVPKNGKKK